MPKSKCQMKSKGPNDKNLSQSLSDFPLNLDFTKKRKGLLGKISL